MIHFNAELWNNHQFYVLQVLNEKETNPARKAENLAKAKMSLHNFIMSQHNIKMSQQKLKVTNRAMSQQGMICRNKTKLSLSWK